MQKDHPQSRDLLKSTAVQFSNLVDRNPAYRQPTLEHKSILSLGGVTAVMLAAMTWSTPGFTQPLAVPTSPQPPVGTTPSSVEPVPISPVLQGNSAATPAGAASPTAPAAGSSLPPLNSTPVRTIIPTPSEPSSTEDSYTLGAGDIIQIDIFDVPELSGEAGRQTILVDGSVNLPWVGRVMLQGKNLDQAAQTITNKYQGYIRDPLITVNLVTARTLKVSIVGEVKRPGSYVINPAATQTNQALVSEGAAGGGGGGEGNQWPTVTQALQTAGGVTQQADLRRVQLRRTLPDGSEQVTDVNLWELLRTGTLSQDITLRDKDVLVVPTATALNSEEALTVGSANFSPSQIRVNVVGEVTTPGVVELPPNTPLNQAIMAAGGFDALRARRGSVYLIRLNPNGTAVRRKVKIDLTAGINDETNPALRDYDTVVIRRNGLASTTDTIGQVFAPFGELLGPFGTIFGIVNDFGD